MAGSAFIEAGASSQIGSSWSVSGGYRLSVSPCLPTQCPGELFRSHPGGQRGNGCLCRMQFLGEKLGKIRVLGAAVIFVGIVLIAVFG